jgi:hypothetical protein
VCLLCWEVSVRILLAIIIYDESKARKHVLEESLCEDKQKNLVIRRSEEAGENRIVCKALDLAGSTVRCNLF